MKYVNYHLTQRFSAQLRLNEKSARAMFVVRSGRLLLLFCARAEMQLNLNIERYGCTHLALERAE